MRAETAQAIIRNHSLFDRRRSKSILGAIARGDTPDLSDLDDDKRERIVAIQQEYARVKSSLKDAGGPRNLPFYLMIKDRYPGFHWEDEAGSITIDFYFQGIKPSLLSLLLDIVPADEASVRRRYYPSLGGLNATLAAACIETFAAEGIVAPSQETMERLVEWFRRGLAGEQLTVVSPVCPDYETVDGVAAKHRFTFNGLGTGSGVPAARLLRSLPKLRQLFDATFGLDCRDRVCPGEFEGFSRANTERLGITEAEFAARVRRSCDALREVLDDDVTVSPFSALCGGRSGWVRRYESMLGRFRAGIFGPLAQSTMVTEAADARRSLYDRWYRVDNMPDDFYRDLVIRQGAEYATMGEIIETNAGCPNPLVLGADHAKMSPFYNLGAELPVLYLGSDYE